jgi:hypothetical protein
MEDRAPDVSSSASQQSYPAVGQPANACRPRRLGFTAYGISGLALFALLAYFFSDFIAH